MKRKSLFKNVVISAAALITVSAVIYSCKKNVQNENPDLAGASFFTEMKSVTPSAIEISAYQVELSFKRDKNSDRTIPTAFELNMPGGKNYQVAITSKSKGFGGVDIYVGTVKDDLAKGPASKMRNFTLIDDPKNNTVFADFSVDKVNYTLSKRDDNTFRLSAIKPVERNDKDAIPASSSAKQATTELAVASGELCDGIYIIDLYVGYSNQAVASIGAGNLTAYANDMVASVNNGLANSLVDNVRVRLVGTGTNPNNPGVVPAALDNGPTWFASGVASTGADLLCLVQQPTNAPGSAGGYGNMPGWVAVAGANWTTVYRHEIGHNLGSNHCEPGIRPYAAGYDNGHWATHMCNNSVNYYSNPDVQDDQGRPLGNANTANNARLWRERAAEMSGRAAHVLPFTDCSSSRQ